MSYRAITKRLTDIAEEADIDKPVNPHHFRHSRATYLASRFTESQLCEWFGWVQGSDRPSTYVHMSGRDIDGDYARLHGIEDDGEEIPEETRKRFSKDAYSGETSGMGGLLYFAVVEIVENYGGKIELRDSELGGVGFDVRLQKANKGGV